MQEVDYQTAMSGVQDMPMPQQGNVVPANNGSMPHEPATQTAQAVAVARNEPQVLARLRALAAAAGERWFYRFPVKDHRTGRQSFIEGPTIKLANDVARVYGNCSVEVRAHDHADHWMFYARFTDLETGYNLTRAFQQYKGATTLKTRDVERARSIAFQIGQSKAIRNVIVNALDTFADFAFQEARANMVETIGKRLEHYRTRAIERINELDIDLSAVERTIGRAAENWLAPDVARVISELQSIREGMTSAAELYPSTKEAEPAKSDFEDAAPAQAKPKRKRRTKAEMEAAREEAAREAANSQTEQDAPGSDRDAPAEPDTDPESGETPPETVDDDDVMAYYVVTPDGNEIGFQTGEEAVDTFNQMITVNSTLKEANGIWESNTALRRQLIGDPDLTEQMHKHYFSLMGGHPPKDA